MSPARNHRAYAWALVGLLWLVACLNYLDRIMLTTMRGSIIAAIPMSETQFGLLTSVFLWVYAACSPIGGFVADRFKRSHVIIGSLLVWSAVTYLTSLATSFEYLLVTRALMGISEACYVPAALALISDYHNEATRSRATAVHMTGMMIGASLGGLGGWVAESHSWNYAFTFFGIVGIAHAGVLMVFLRDAPDRDHRRAIPAVAGSSGVEVHFGGALRHLFGTRSFVYAFIYWGLLGVLWTIIGWMPTYLTERFQLGQGIAGLSATGYLQASAMVGVLVGGYWSDRWSRKTPRARIYVPMIGLGFAAVALWTVSSMSILWLALGALVLHGFFRAFTDANMMPILCLITDERYRATGYGILNFCACVVGGLSIYAGGVLRDTGIPLGHLFQFAAVCLVFCGWLLLLMKIEPTATLPHPR